jgi:coenzyme F420-reducing hydrogenase beta subunit
MSSVIIDKVVDRGLCIGCGVCAGMCPNNYLEMRFNKVGEYNAYEQIKCTVDCGVCSKVCPFFPGNDSEDVLAEESFANVQDIRYRKETGFYLNSYYGHSLEAGHRLKGASGGLATWLLENLILQKKVDSVICVSTNNDTQKLFKFEVFNSVESIRKSSGSVYYPVELSDVIRLVLQSRSSFAIIGLPCFIKAIRLAQKKDIRLKERIRYLIGLVCGQTKSRDCTSFIAAMAGVKGGLKEVFYRGKDCSRSADNFAFKAENNNGDKGKIYWYEGVQQVWESRWFTPRSCNYCDDVFSELADVVFMDAWMAEYIRDGRGGNLVIVKSLEIDGILGLANREGRINLQSISIGRVIKSQLNSLNIKRNHLTYRLYLAKKSGLDCIPKRISPMNALNFFERKEVWLKDKMQEESKKIFYEMVLEDRVDPHRMYKALKASLDEVSFWKKLYNFLRLPQRVLLKIKRLIFRPKTYV